MVPALDVRRLPRILAPSRVLLIGKDWVIGRPESRLAMTGLLSCRDCFPELATSSLTAGADDLSHDLAWRTAQREPHPTFVNAPQDEGPQLIQRQDGCVRVASSRLNQRLAQGRERRFFFLSQSLTVLRATPKVRVKPRQLRRSW